MLSEFQDSIPTNSISTTVGLCIALGGPPLLAMSDRLFGNDTSLARNIVQQGLLFGLCITILGIVSWWEKLPLSSIGLQPLRWQAIALGLVFAGILMLIYAPLLMWVIQTLNLPGFDHGLEKLSSMPIWYLILAVVIGGTTEEILYRGYAIERLSSFTGNYLTGSLFVLVAFGIAHVPLWGWTPASTTVISGGLLTLFYVWTGDLLPCIIAHIITDSMGIIIPALERQN